ncbi:hypothetical protein Pmani_014961 [Petrolisthes manimaculis]|uniref:Uncharacterized protein n=1 Tax=Petrolisthes manimaculis TaxID=1843537 RepID=A0AAE1PVC1_9EUCA|nr:hypothetical protein Pmani_014961 [Petrolisthes manimaculis]
MQWDFDATFNSLFDDDSEEEDEEEELEKEYEGLEEGGGSKDKKEEGEEEEKDGDKQYGHVTTAENTPPHAKKQKHTRKVPIAEEYESTLIIPEKTSSEEMMVDSDSTGTRRVNDMDIENEKSNCDASLLTSGSTDEKIVNKGGDSNDVGGDKNNSNGDSNDSDNNNETDYENSNETGTHEISKRRTNLGYETWRQQLVLEEDGDGIFDESLSTYEEIKRNYLRHQSQSRKGEDVAAWERRLRRQRVKKELACLKIYKDYYRISTKLKEEDFVRDELTEFDRRLLYGPRKRKVDGVPVDRLAKPRLVDMENDDHHEAQARIEFLKQFQDELEREKRVYLVAIRRNT